MSTDTDCNNQSKYRLYKNFNEFCDNIDTPEELVEWFKQTKHTFSTQKNEKYMTWPDALVNGEPSLCLDHAFFVYMWAKSKKLRTRIIVTVFIYKEGNGIDSAHIIPVVLRYKNRAVLIDISGKNSEDSYLHYFDNFKDLRNEFNSTLFFDKMVKSDPNIIGFKWDWTTYHGMQELETYINQKVVQNDILQIINSSVVFL